MRKIFITSILLLISLFVKSQSKYDQGFLVEKNGNKIYCLIENLNWKYSPKQVNYKLSETSEKLKINTNEVEAFGIENGDYYAWFEGDLPIEDSLVFTENINPEFEYERYKNFVKQIIKGRASLFEFKEKGNNLFLFSKESESNLEVLLPEKDFYSISKEGTRALNFRSQLIKDFNCRNSLNVQKVIYSYKSLQDYFTAYNNCAFPDSTSVRVKQQTWRRKNLSLKVLVGASYYTYETTLNSQPLDFDKRIRSNVGVELEYELPVKKDNFSTFISLRRSAYFSPGTFETSTNPNVPKNEVNAATLDLVQFMGILGGRYYFTRINSIEIFAEAAALMDFNINSSFRKITGFQTESTTLKKTNLGASIGVGLSINRRAYLNINYLPSSSIFKEEIKPDQLKRVMMTFGFKF